MGSILPNELITNIIIDFSKRTIYMLRIINKDTKLCIDHFLSNRLCKPHVNGDVFMKAPNPNLSSFFYINATHNNWKLYKQKYLPFIHEIRNSDLYSWQQLLYMKNLVKLSIVVSQNTCINVINKLSRLTSLTIRNKGPDTNQILSQLSIIAPNLKKLFLNSEKRAIVNFDLYHNITSLSIKNSDNAISSLLHLTKLRKLKMSSSLIDHNISNLTNLQHLYISLCTFTESILLTNLTSLTIHHHNSTYLLDNIKYMLNLKNLDLRGSNYNTIKDDCRLTTVTQLKTWSDHITNSNLTNFINLKSLDINNANNVSDDGVGKLTNLTDLNICNQRISGDCFSNLTNITRLDFFFVKIISDTNLSKLSNLTHIKTHYTEISLRVIEKLVNLEYLCLYPGVGCQILNFSLSNLTKLRTLYITVKNNITYANLSKLKNLTELKLQINYIEQLDNFELLTYLTTLTICKDVSLKKRPIKLKEQLINTDIVFV